MLYSYKTRYKHVVFVSDLHVGHDKDFLWGPRGFKSVEEHDAAMVERWNSVCTNSTEAFHLGDLTFNDPKGERFRKLVGQLKFGSAHFLLGNHNSGQKHVYHDELGMMFSDFERVDFEAYPIKTTTKNVSPEEKGQGRLITFWPEYLEIFCQNQHIVLCHYPIYSHHKAGKGSWMLCGHSHGNCALTNKDTGKGKRLDVGIESFGRPVSFDEIQVFMADRAIEEIDHHNSSTT